MPTNFVESETVGLVLFLGHWTKKSSILWLGDRGGGEGRVCWLLLAQYICCCCCCSACWPVRENGWPARFSPPHFFLSLEDHRQSNREWILTLITLERQTIMDWYVASFKPQSWRTKNRCPEQNELFPPLWTSKREKSIPKHPLRNSIDG